MASGHAEMYVPLLPLHAAIQVPKATVHCAGCFLPPPLLPLDRLAALPCSKLRLKTAETDLVVLVVKQCAE